MSTENQIATPNVQSEPFMTSNLIVASGIAPGAVSVGPSGPKQSGLSAAGSAAGIEDEETLWEGRYSSKNFLGRGLLGALLIVGWLALALTVWGFGHTHNAFLAQISGVFVVLYCLVLGFKFLRARGYYHYRLTTRRLFFKTGLLERRVDQVELVKIKDLFMRQSLLNSWLDLGTLVLISSEPTLPKAQLLGIDEPRRVLDLIWYHTRLERDERATEVHPV